MPSSKPEQWQEEGYDSFRAWRLDERARKRRKEALAQALVASTPPASQPILPPAPPMLGPDAQLQKPLFASPLPTTTYTQLNTLANAVQAQHPQVVQPPARGPVQLSSTTFELPPKKQCTCTVSTHH